MSKQKPLRIYNVNVNQFFMGFLVAWNTHVFSVYCVLLAEVFHWGFFLRVSWGGVPIEKENIFILSSSSPSLIQTVFQTLFSIFNLIFIILYLFILKIKPFPPFRLVFFQPSFVVWNMHVFILLHSNSNLNIYFSSSILSRSFS